MHIRYVVMPLFYRSALLRSDVSNSFHFTKWEKQSILWFKAITLCINVKSTQCLRHIQSRQSMLFVGHLQFDSISFERYVLHLTIAYLSIHSVVLSQLHIAKVVQFSVYFVLCFRFFVFLHLLHSFIHSLAHSHLHHYGTHIK